MFLSLCSVCCEQGADWCPLWSRTRRDTLRSLRTRCCCRVAAADSVSLNRSFNPTPADPSPSRRRRDTQTSEAARWIFHWFQAAADISAPSLRQREMKRWRCLLSVCKTGRLNELMMRRKMSKGRRMRHTTVSSTETPDTRILWVLRFLWDGSQFQFYNVTNKKITNVSESEVTHQVRFYT